MSAPAASHFARWEKTYRRANFHSLSRFNKSGKFSRFCRRNYTAWNAFHTLMSAVDGAASATTLPIIVDIVCITQLNISLNTPPHKPILPPYDEKNTMNTSRVILQLVLFAALIASAIGSRAGASSAWHAPPKKAFGIRKNSSRRSSPKSISTVTIDTIQQASASANLMDAISQDDENTEQASPRNQRIIPASARAAAVAFVSAAAIGTTRHALERIIPL